MISISYHYDYDYDYDFGHDCEMRKSLVTILPARRRPAPPGLLRSEGSYCGVRVPIAARREKKNGPQAGRPCCCCGRHAVTRRGLLRPLRKAAILPCCGRCVRPQYCLVAAVAQGRNIALLRPLLGEMGDKDIRSPAILRNSAGRNSAQ